MRIQDAIVPNLNLQETSSLASATAGSINLYVVSGILRTKDVSGNEQIMNASSLYAASAAYAVSASTAVQATTAVKAVSATYASTAIYATTAGTAAYSVSCATASYAVSADYSTSGVYAVSATTAAYATSAGTLSGLAAVSAINNAVSGLVTAIDASALNLLSGLTVTAGQINYSTSFPASAAYAASANYAVSAATAGYSVTAGELSGVTVTAGHLNNILYGSTMLKYAIGSTLASDGMILSHGLNTGLFAMCNAQSSGIMANCLVSATGVQFFIMNSSGINTSSILTWIVYGN